MSFGRVAVVGAGLIGGSVALRLAARGVDVVVADPHPEARDLAAAAGLVVVDVVPADADVVVLAAPLDALPGLFAGVAAAAPGAVVIDLGSVKSTPAAAAEAAGLAARYVGVHPMAGAEQSGFEHADAKLLVGATWAVVRGAGPVAEVVAWVAEQFEATVMVLDAAAHDRSVALVSHAPHVLAQALLELVEEAPDAVTARHLAAGSFASGTRVAGTSPARTFNMLAENADALRPVVDQLLAILTAYRAELDDVDALRERLHRVGERAPQIRVAQPAWAPVDDVAAALAGDDAVLVRLTDTGWQTASP